MKLNPEVLRQVVSGLGSVIDGAVGFLPDKLATKVREGRKAIVSLAGGTATLLAALDVFSLPPSIAPWVAVGLLVTTAIGTWATPNEPAKS